MTSDAAGRRQRAFIVGLGGLTLSTAEAAFLRKWRPCGVIVFTRNFSTNTQLLKLITDIRGAINGAELLVLVDQEGGRVQRLRGTEWPAYPSAEKFGAAYRTDPAGALEAAALCSQWLGGQLRRVGINTNCVPCLDVPVTGADAIIGNRAYGDDIEVVSALGRAVASGTLAGGVVPVVKHVPGHGRANVDSHLALPVVDAPLDELRRQDFVPFRRVIGGFEFGDGGLPAAMSAHVTYSGVDPDAPASISEKVTREIIRGEIGFDGLLMSDDVSMHALCGTIADRSRAVIAAGSDVILHCNGEMEEMLDVAGVAPLLEGRSLERFERCLEIVRRVPGAIDEAAVQATLRQFFEDVGA